MKIRSYIYIFILFACMVAIWYFTKSDSDTAAAGGARGATKSDSKKDYTIYENLYSEVFEKPVTLKKYMLTRFEDLETLKFGAAFQQIVCNVYASIDTKIKTLTIDNRNGTKTESSVIGVLSLFQSIGKQNPTLGEVVKHVKINVESYDKSGMIVSFYKNGVKTEISI